MDAELDFDKMNGFKQYVRSGIIIRSGETPRIDVQLEVGAVSESVTVAGGTPLLDTETAESGQTLSGDELVKLPVSQKSVQRMLYYYPGVSSMSGFHVLGQRQNSIGFQVDGIEGKEPGIRSASWCCNLNPSSGRWSGGPRKSMRRPRSSARALRWPT